MHPILVHLLKIKKNISSQMGQTNKKYIFLKQQLMLSLRYVHNFYVRSNLIQKFASCDENLMMGLVTFSPMMMMRLFVYASSKEHV